MTYPEDNVCFLASLQGTHGLCHVPRGFILNFLQDILNKCHFVYSFMHPTSWFPDWTLRDKKIGSLCCSLVSERGK